MYDYAADERPVADHPHRMLERMEAHTEMLTHMGLRLSNVMDRIHGPMPEPMNKTSDGCEPSSNMKWQMDKAEIQARRIYNLIEALESSL